MDKPQNTLIQRSHPMQGAPKGAPDPAALAAVEAANMAPTTEAPTEPETPDQFLQLLSDPDVATTIVQAAASTEIGRKLLNIPPGKGAAVGVWRRNYDAEEALRVHGGVEVRHAPGFVPLPPSYIKRYLTADGKKTDYDKPHVQKMKKSIPLKDDSGKIIVNEEGNQVWREELVDVVVDPGAARNPDGSPKMTPEYKLWLDTRLAGKRLGSTVRNDIIADKFIADDVGANV